MAKDSKDNSAAVRKVERAAETAGQRDLSVRSRLGFPAIVGLICVLGVALVTFARLTREAEALPVQNRDHWHAVYGIYDCNGGGAVGTGAYLPPLLGQLDPLGIHSHQDGIIHIHPFFDAADGPDAQLKIFTEAMEAELSDERLVLDTGQEIADGTDCGELGVGELHVRKWQFDFVTDSTDPEIFTEGLGEINFLNDREVYVITNAPVDAEIPLPPSDRFEQLNNVAGAITSSGPVTAEENEGIDFNVEAPDDADTAPADDADTAPADDADTAPADDADEGEADDG